MLRLPSNQREYDTYWSGDPAFVQPVKNENGEIDPDVAAEHAAKVKRATQTGDWSELRIDGQEPTKFVMQPISGKQWRYLVDESTRTDEHRMGTAVFWSYIFRCACTSIKNLGMTVNDKPVRDKDHPYLGPIAPQDMPDVLDKIDGAIVTELAAAALERAQNLDPL
jgi:hypothetical protein